MAYDGSVLRSVIYDLKDKLVNAKIDKIYQVNDFDIVINFRNLGQRYKLFISAANNNPRMYLSDYNYSNPQNPPAFCMLLRKHLEGFKVENVEQYKMDRIFRIDINSRNELGDELKKSLFVEIMGKHSNIILVESDSLSIIDSIKRVNSSMSRVRQILPRLKYEIEPISTAENPLLEDAFINNIDIFNPNKAIRNNIIKSFTGISALMASEILYKARVDESKATNSLTKEEFDSINDSFNETMKILSRNEYSPILIYKDNNLSDFFSINLEHIREEDKKSFDNISQMLELYYSESKNNQLILDKSQNIKRIIKKNIDKENKKLAKQSDELNSSLDRDKYKVYADLISANSYKIKTGDESVLVENFYDNMNELEIDLDKKLSPHENANKYYKKFSKLKHAEKVLKIEIPKTKSKINYLENLMLNLELSDSEDDIDEIKDELHETGYLKRYKKHKNKKNKLKILKYETENGDKIYCGKNNKQNEHITFKLANREDLWFHVKDAPGSHVILTNDNFDFSEDSIKKAAFIAAMNSSISTSNNISVDYCRKKYVKRHPAKMPGLVVYTDYDTINIKKDDIDLSDLKKI